MGQKQPIRIFFFYWFPIFIYCLVLFVQSSFPASENIPSIIGFDKVLHFFAYALLGALFLRAFRANPTSGNTMILLALSIILSSLYGMSDEIHQAFVPSRSADVFDAVADTLGSICGVLAYNKFTGP